MKYEIKATGDLSSLLRPCLGSGLSSFLHSPCGYLKPLPSASPQLSFPKLVTRPCAIPYNTFEHQSALLKEIWRRTRQVAQGQRWCVVCALAHGSEHMRRETRASARACASMRAREREKKARAHARARLCADDREIEGETDARMRLVTDITHIAAITTCNRYRTVTAVPPFRLEGFQVKGDRSGWRVCM